MRRLSSFLSRILDISPSEAPHVLISWILTLFSRVANVIGWTILVVIFVGKYGIFSLPVLFGLHALGTIVGSSFFTGLVNKFKKENLLITIVLACAGLLAVGSYLYEYSEYLFIASIFICLSVLIAQMRIVLSLFVEDLFTPTQSTRVFPIIESADTFGLIIGGALVALLSPILAIHKFLYVWMIVLLLSIPALFYYLRHSIAIPFVQMIKGGHSGHVAEGRFESIAKFLGFARRVKFLQTLILVVFLQWTFFSILEFQYTKAIEESIVESPETAVIVGDSNEFSKASSFIAKVTDNESLKDDHFSEDKFEQSFAADLGYLQTIFGIATLIFQLFLASRFLKYLGLVESMLIYPIVLIVSILWMGLRPNLWSALVSKFNHEVAYVLHRNAYHASYYILPHDFRGNVKEFLEGFVRPIGSLFGTVLLTGIMLSRNSGNEFGLTVVSFVLLIFMLVITLNMKSSIEELPKKELKESVSLNGLINAINLISQNARHTDMDFLQHIYSKRTDFHVDVRREIIKAIGEYGSPKNMTFLISILKEDSELRLDALHAINSLFSNFYEEIYKKPFTLHALKALYRDLLASTDDPRLKGELISFIILSNYHEGFAEEIVNYLNDELHEDTLSMCTEVLKKIEDHQVANYLYPLLKRTSPRLRADIIFITWEYSKHDPILTQCISELLRSDSRTNVLEALILVVKIKVWDEVELDIQPLHAADKHIQFLRLACSYLSSGDHRITQFLYENLKYEELEDICLLADRTQNPEIMRLVRKRLESEIHDIYLACHLYLEDDSKVNVQTYVLNRLKLLYKLIRADKEFFMVEEILRLKTA